MKVIKDIFRVWVNEQGELVALMYENGHDTIYKLKRATKADKDELFETPMVDMPGFEGTITNLKKLKI